MLVKLMDSQYFLIIRMMKSQLTTQRLPCRRRSVEI